MLFYKRDLRTFITFSLISVTIITVNGGGNQSARNGNQSNGDMNEEEYVGYTSCWNDMKSRCRMNKPEAIDFVRKAIMYWTEVDLIDMPALRKYYNSLRPNLDAEDILYPEDYCFIYESEPVIIPGLAGEVNINEDDEETEEAEREICKRALSHFGGSNKIALEYGFYDTKYQPPSTLDTSDSAAMLSDIQKLEYSAKFLRYMSNHVKLRGRFLSPLEFCKEYDAEARF